MGMVMIAVAAAFRLWDSGLPIQFYMQKETGQDARSPVSMEAISPHFFESSPPVFPEEQTPLVFSPEASALLTLTYGCQVEPDVEALLCSPLEWDLEADKPRVLILHTHATESYTKNGEGYTESSSFRTLDEGYNMLSLGDRVTQLLEAQGISVLHDRTLHDYPSYNGSYNHARKAIQKILVEHPTIQLILDLHRDAAEGPAGQLRTHADVGGASSAQLMPVIGTGVGGLGNDHWQENLALAEKLTVLLEQENPGITRPISLRAQRFNQDLHPHALLIEIGAAGNTHEEALTAAEALARAIIQLRKGSVRP